MKLTLVDVGRVSLLSGLLSLLLLAISRLGLAGGLLRCLLSRFSRCLGGGSSWCFSGSGSGLNMSSQNESK